ncbi:MAG: ATP-binding protein [Elusimicrobiota bacterium]
MSAPDKKTAAYLTHELRAPLRALQYALELLKGELDKGASGRKSVRLSLRVKRGCPRITGDPKRIIQVLTNLLSNALKFTPAGGEIEVGAAPGERDDAGCVVFSVRDTGCGISPEDLRRVFRYFVQVGSPEQKAEGTGLGLPLARSLVEIQGGRMWAESEPGKGSMFYFTIPAALLRGAGDASGTGVKTDKSQR